MPESAPVALWDKVDPTVLPSKDPSAAAAKEEKEKVKWKRTKWALADLVGWFIWTYAILKLFVADFDRWILANVAPQAMWLVDFRFFVLLTALAVALLLFRKKRAWWIVYVLAFPLVVLFFKIPRSTTGVRTGSGSSGPCTSPGPCSARSGTPW